MKIKIKNFKNLIFENIGIRQTILKNTLWLIAAEGIYQFFKIILIIYIIRILGPVEFGKFIFAMAFVSILAMFSDFGLSAIVTREFSQNEKSEKEYPAILSLKILLSIGALILMLLGSFFITSDFAIRKLIWILAIFILIDNFFYIICAFFHARQRMEYEFGIKVLQTLTITSAGFFVLLKFPSIENISYGYLIGNLIAMVLVLLFIHFRLFPLNLKWDKDIWRRFSKLFWPLGLSTVFGAIFINADLIIMGRLGQIAEVGYYGVARRIIGLLIIPATLISMSFFPVLSRVLKESLNKLQRFWNFYMELMIILAVPLVVGGLVLAPYIINFIYGGNFGSSVIVFQILIFIVGINFLCYPYILMLIASGQQKKNFLINLILAITNIFLNLILIPRYSLYGAAIACVITYVVFLILLAGFSKYFIPIPIFNLRLLKVLIFTIFSGLIMFIVFKQLLIYNFNLVFIIIIGILIYFASLLTFYKFLYKLRLLSKN